MMASSTTRKKKPAEGGSYKAGAIQVLKGLEGKGWTPSAGRCC